MPTTFRLSEILARRGMSQSELARLSGVSHVTINRMCGNVTEGVTLATLDKIATTLKVEPGELIVQERKGKR